MGGKLWLGFGTFVFFYVLGVACRGRKEAYDDKDLQDPAIASAMILGEIRGLTCHKGYYNVSDEFMDAVYHCADVKYNPKSHKKFSKHKVQWDGSAPMLCLKTCIARETGALNCNSTGLNQHKTLEMFQNGMFKPGGNASAHQVTAQLLDCDKKHPTVFPTTYGNCTGTDEVFKCYARVLRDCEPDEHPEEDLMDGRD